jgi:hypothetical protein
MTKSEWKKREIEKAIALIVRLEVRLLSARNRLKAIRLIK